MAPWRYGFIFDKVKDVIKPFVTKIFFSPCLAAFSAISKANSKYIVGRLKEWIGFLGEILIYPGEDEMKALALGGLRVLRGEEEAKTYPESVGSETD